MDVLHFFEEICKIPHGSGNIRQISDYLADFARERKLEYVQDSIGNVIISKPATAGYEKESGIILQGHMDMVAVKKPDCLLDMKKDGLKLSVDGDWMYAEGTSLGGDDGIAVAYALTILDSKTISHPHLEAIFTVDEETGMDGAREIDLSGLKGTRLLNLDSEEEGVFLAGCAGGARVRHILPVVREKREGVRISCEIAGLLGGHSGEMIHKERGNSNVLMGRLLKELEQYRPGVLELHGGVADNAIANKTTAEFIIAPEMKEEVLSGIKEFEEKIKRELIRKDPQVEIKVNSSDITNGECIDADTYNKITRAIIAMPNGVLAMSADVPGLVQTSLNMGMLKLEADEFYFVQSVRSSVESEKEMLLDKVSAITELAGGTVRVTGRYPGWAYAQSSPLRDLCLKVYREMYGKEARVTVIHAGLECGLLLDKKPDLDCVSLGPDMKDIHTAQEKLSLSSVGRVWEFLLKVLSTKQEG